MPRETAHHPLAAVEAQLEGILALLRVPPRRRAGRSRWAVAAWVLANGTFTIFVLGAVAHWARSPLVFPSLGPTAFVLFFDPLGPQSSPRNALVGHAIGAAAGWALLVAFDLAGQPAAMGAGVPWARAAAAALSLGVTSALLALLRTPHAPAGATTLIVSLGLLPRASDLALLLAAVALLLLQAFAVNRLAGLPYPAWAPRPGAGGGG